MIASTEVHEEPVEVPDDAPSADEELGSYVVFEEIASGGMATVHLGWLETPSGGRFVAIKRMLEHYAKDPDFRSMFLDEVALCARIRHPNVVGTIDVAQDDDAIELVLELVEGESLSRLSKSCVARAERVPQAVVSRIVIDMLHGLHAAHEATNARGEPLMLVHRDVSPHNVMVGVDGVSKVLDFGVAKAQGRMQQTQKGQLKGKLSYMSPEQARGRPVDRRSDVFASGVVLWELLTGRRLFDGDNEAAILTALLIDQPAPPSTVDADLAPLDALVMRALSVAPDERYATALEMALAVEEAIPPASRSEVGAWVSREARLPLAKRAASTRRAQARIAAAPTLEAAARGLGGRPASSMPPPRRTHTPAQGSGSPRSAPHPAPPAHARAANPSDATQVLQRPDDPRAPAATAPEPRAPEPRAPEPPGPPAAPLPTPPVAPPPALRDSPAPAALPAFAPPPGFGAHPRAPLPSYPGVAPSSGPALGPASTAELSGLDVLAPHGASAAEPPHEGAASQVSSVNLSTTHLSPPLPAEQLRRLQRVALVAFALSTALAALLVGLVGSSSRASSERRSALRPALAVAVEKKLSHPERPARGASATAVPSSAR